MPGPFTFSVLSSKFFVEALVVGALIRAAALPLPGTTDVAVWKTWSYAAAHQPIGTMYGVGGSPPVRALVSFRDLRTTVDYPPLALQELGLAGRFFRWATDDRFPNSTELTVTIKAMIVSADVGLLLLLYFGLRRVSGEDAARLAAIAYWLNPAVLLDGSMLGYLDPLFVLPATGSLVAATLGSPLAAGALGAAAVFTKPQAVVLAPAIAIAIWRADGRGRAIVRASAALAAAALVAALAVAPVVLAGGWANMLYAFSRLATHDMLSADACNLWWIVGYLVRVKYAVHDMGLWAALTMQTRILGISRLVELGYPNVRPVGIVLALLAMGWGLWTGRRARDLWLTSALGAFLVHAYATLSAQVHENHLFAAVPLLAIAAAGRPRFMPVLVAVSAILALNLNMFLGISEGVGYAIPRDVTILDLSVVLAVVNCAALVWHAAVFRSECSTADARRQSPAPA